MKIGWGALLFVASAIVISGYSAAVSQDVEVILKRIQNEIEVNDERIECSLFFDVKNHTGARVKRLRLPLVAIGSNGSPLRVIGDTSLEVATITSGSVVQNQLGPKFDGEYSYCDIDVLEVANKHLIVCRTTQDDCRRLIKLTSDVSDVEFRFSKDFDAPGSTFRTSDHQGTGAAPTVGSPLKVEPLTPEQMFVLGLKYFRGEGVIQDYVSAHMWFNIAASLGLDLAQAEREKVTEKMTREELADARKLARQCVKRSYQNC